MALVLAEEPIRNKAVHLWGIRIAKRIRWRSVVVSPSVNDVLYPMA